MSVVSGILDEEKRRLESLLERRRASLGEIPEGAIRKKKIGERFYLYRVFRESGHVVTKYLCALDSPKAATILDSEKRRRQLKLEIKNLSRDLSEIRRTLGRIGRK